MTAAPEGPRPGDAHGLPIDVQLRGAGPALVFLHGFGASRFTFRIWADDLARDHALHLIDLKGFGAAPSPAPGGSGGHEGWGPIELAELVLAYLRAADLTGAVLIGHSLGGGLALLVALRLRELGEEHRLAGIVSIAGPAYPQAIPRYIGLARVPLLGRLLFALAGPERIVRAVLRMILHDPSAVTDEQVEGYAGPLRRPATQRAVIEAARAIVPDTLGEIVARFPTIDVPTLLLWGRHDPVIPLWVGERLARELPDARLVVLEACGHDPPEECPERSLGVVREFLRRIRG